MQRVKNVDYDEDNLYEEDGYEEAGEGDAYSAEDRESFASLTPVVRAELEEAGLQASDLEIEEALWHYYWDVSKSVSYLQNTRTPRPQQSKQTKKEEKPKSKFDQAAEKSAQEAGKAKQAAANGLAQKTEALRLEEKAPQQSKVRSKGLNVPQTHGEEKRKPSAAFVVIGHVDHGKSTLMGRLLLDTGTVSQRDIDKYTKQASEMGKSSFALAWVMDTRTDEREHGVTIDVAEHRFHTDSMDFTILDAPGHRDFVPNMISGASMADLAVLVVDANQLESGMKGQTREHILITKTVGLKKLIVAINKLDSTTPAWSEDTFSAVSTEVRALLQDTGFSDVTFVPCSGLSGGGVVKKANGADWLSKHPTLIEALERSIPAGATPEEIKGLLRMRITGVFRGGIQNPHSVTGRISSGNLQVGDSVIIQPSGEQATIKGIEVLGDVKEYAVAGQIATIHLQDIDERHLRTGSMLCGGKHPVAVEKRISATVQALSPLIPETVEVHMGGLDIAGSITSLVAVVDGAGEVVKRRPRLVKSGQTAQIKITLEGEGAAVEVGSRLVLRAAGTTIAYGTVASCLKS